ncbi:MAG TPA: VWA domain-containing protein [Gammaproteobacteria bacterium]|nr:VWA domain-containing protein [Gammaproteobacteria bacterium]
MFNIRSDFNFSSPEFLLAMLVPLIIIAFSYVYHFLSVNRYCDKKLLPWVIQNDRKKRLGSILKSKVIAIISFWLFCLALAGPRINIDERSINNQTRFNSATVIVLDISRSMLANDVYPDRITKAKLVIDTILAKKSQRLFSLIVFANNAHTVIPFTYDSQVIRHTLNSIRPNMLPVEGSNVKAGIKLATKQLDKLNIKDTNIFLFTDGDFSIQNLERVNTDKNLYQLHVFGTGSTEGEAIPLKSGGWLSMNNRPVISRLNETRLKKLAQIYNGQYRNISNVIDTNEIHTLIASATKTSLSQSTSTIIIWKQIYQWFLIPAFILYLFSTVSIMQNTKKIASQAPVISSISMVIFVLLLLSPVASNAAEDPLRLANRAYLNKNFIKAEKLYKKADGFAALFGEASSLYKQKNYLTATHVFSEAILATHSNKQRAKALYNLANSYYMMGNYEQAIKIYRDALKYSTELKQAAINLQYAITLDKKVKQLLALRKGKKISSVRPGSGPRSARIEQGIDIGTSKVTLDNSKQEDIFYNLPLNNGLKNRLIQRGIRYSRVNAERSNKTENNDNWHFEYTTLDMIELLVNQEKFDSFNLWKRLFEIEEGFPAPVEEPKTLPGIQPW